MSFPILVLAAVVSPAEGEIIVTGSREPVAARDAAVKADLATMINFAYDQASVRSVDQATLDRINSGELQELSCGYDCMLEMTPATGTQNGQTNTSGGGSASQGKWQQDEADQPGPWNGLRRSDGGAHGFSLGDGTVGGRTTGPM